MNFRTGIHVRKGRVRVRRLFAFDTETTHKGRFICGVVFDGETFYKFREPSRLADFFRSGRLSGAICFAHNAAFDLAAVYGLNPEEFLTLRFGRGGLLWGVLRDSNGKKVRFWDTFNHYQKSLKEIGKLVKLPKLETKFTGRFSYKLLEYCCRDTEITWRFANYLQERYNQIGANLNATAAATAYDLFARRFCSRDYARPSLDSLNFLRRSYFGGRTEIFRHGRVDHTLHYADVNSMYPSVMIDPLPLPDRLIECRNADDSVLGYEGVSSVTLESPDVFAPVLPYRSPNNGKLLFPVGRWSGVYTHNELRYALSCGYKLTDIRKSLYSEESVALLSGYVKELYRLRTATDKDFDKVVFKLLMNSLYGKFATGSRRVEYLSLKEAAERVLKDGETGIRVGSWLVIQGPKSDYAAYTNFIWSSYICAAARVKLHKLFPPSLVYCDTDSIVSFKRFPETKKLGENSHVKTYDGGEFILPKFYRLWGRDGKHMRAKGFPKPQVESAFKNRSAEFEKPNKFRESIRNGLDVNSWEKTCRIVKTEYDKREVRSDGRTWPLEISEG